MNESNRVVIANGRLSVEEGGVKNREVSKVVLKEEDKDSEDCRVSCNKEVIGNFFEYYFSALV